MAGHREFLTKGGEWTMCWLEQPKDTNIINVHIYRGNTQGVAEEDALQFGRDFVQDVSTTEEEYHPLLKAADATRLLQEWRKTAFSQGYMPGGMFI